MGEFWRPPRTGNDRIGLNVSWSDRYTHGRAMVEDEGGAFRDTGPPVAADGIRMADR